jgi:GAF domain-containing protein
MSEKDLIPICAWCKNIRTDADWEKIETYLSRAGFGVFTHGLCPECAEKYFDKRVYLESYQNICKAISGSLSLDDVLDLIVSNVVKVMKVKASMLRLLDRKGNRLDIAAHYGLSENYVNKGAVASDASIEDALKGKAVSVYDITADEASPYRKDALAEGIRSILSVPLKVKGDVIGVLRMYTSEPVKYTREDLKFVTALAEQAAIAIDNARLFETRISKEKEYLRVFEDVTKAVSSTLSLQEVLGMIVKKLPEVMRLKAATIRLLEEDGRSLKLVAASGLSERYLGRGPVDAEINIREALQLRPVLIPDVASDTRLIYGKEAVQEGIKSMLTLPIVANGKLLGVLRLLTGVMRDFDDDDIRFSASLAEVCGIAIENARMYEALHRRKSRGTP